MVEAQSVRERILKAAEKRMSSVGYHAVSFRDLADDVGVKSSSVHYYFPQKEDLGEELVKQYSAMFFTELGKIDNKSDDPLAAIQKFLAIYANALVIGKAVCLCAVLGAETNSLPDKIRISVRDFFRANIAWLQVVYDRVPSSASMMTPIEMLSAIEGAMIVSSTMKSRKAYDAIAHRIETGFSDAMDIGDRE